MSSKLGDGVPKLDIDKYLSPLRINGLKGRMLHLPAPKKTNQEILLVYGHHASIERMFGLAKALNRYGSITIPDLPGFGGMDSFYKIGKKPTIDNLADYLATVIKFRYRKRKITVIAVSLGFSIVTRMLEKYPDLAKQVELCVSAVGFTSGQDISIPPFKKRMFKALSRFLSWFIPSKIAKLILQKPVIRYMYRNDTARSHSSDETEERRKYRLDFEVWLWQNNDVRTHFFTLHQMLTMDLCQQQVNLPVYHISADSDQYLDSHLVEQHMRVIYSDFERLKVPKSKAKAHAPTIVATAKEASAFIPPRLRRLLNQHK